VATRTPKPTLGALFIFLAAVFGGVSYAAGVANGGGVGHWIVAVCAGLIALWMAGLSIAFLRPR
jgi:hypothetical protein